MKIFRDDKRYIEIENIKEYELTNCISFEMAIRNKNVQKSILELIAIKNFDDYIFTDIFFEDKEFVDIFNKYFKIKNKKQFVSTIHEIMLSDKFFIDSKSINNFSPDLINFIYESLNIKYESNDEDDPFDYDEDYEKTESPNLNKNQLKEIKKYLIPSNNSDLIYNCSEHFNHINIFYHTENFITNQITQKFSKPTLKIKKNLQQNVSLINLNFNLPKNELMKYIESIYDYYQKIPINSISNTLDSDDYIEISSLLFWKKNTYYKTFKQQFTNSNFNKNSKITDLFYFTYDDKRLDTKNVTKINTIKNSKDWADCFFIYDYIKLSNIFKSNNEKIRFIIENLDDYHNESKFKRNAIMDRFNLMINYIDYLKYKDLLIG